LISDVVLVLIGPGTSQSEWVKRELALAKALTVTVVPIGFDPLTWNEMETELKGLEIYDRQGKITNNIKGGGGPALLEELRADLEGAAEQTKKNQDITLRDLLTRRVVKAVPAPNKQKCASLRLRGRRAGIRLHVASGDISKVRGIDVIVNSENDYMQMARFFDERRTVSSILRQMGASRSGAKYDDTIQRELDYELRDRSRPVQAADTFVTSTGCPNSELYKQTKARFIPHVAAVQAVIAERKVVPFCQSDQIEACVRQCLTKVAEINAAKGIVSPPDTPQRAEQEKLASTADPVARSIIFPIFGTGHGGSTIANVIPAMLNGIQCALDDLEGTAVLKDLKDIYISAFTQSDVEAVVSLLTKELA
jgi:O-acetyl-ADP-ribose deacetylase (regulator of RNase III)